jgi:hypothetical protein
MIELTLTEAKELCATIQNLTGSAALRRVQKKASDELLRLKRQAIFNEGAKAARADLKKPDRLAKAFKRTPCPYKEGNFIIMRWYDGYQSVDSSVNHPYYDTKGRRV